MRTLISFSCFLCLSASAWAAFRPSVEGKKLISYGGDWPNTAYVREHIREMETRPYDGIVIGVSRAPGKPELNGDTLGIHCFSRTRIKDDEIAHAIEDLKATTFQKFTDNFIQVQATPGDVDWFDDDGWDAICHNIAMLSRVAREGGCVGIEFDPEEYNDNHVWSYSLWPQNKRGGRSEAQYIDQARQRGQQFIRAINHELPKARILCLFGPALTAAHERAGDGEYRLLLPFIEGMCIAAGDGTQVIDGYEQSYGYRVPMAFAEGRKSVLAARDLFQDKAAFDRVMRVGFGLWLDYNSGRRGWYPDEPQRNHFQPETWQNAVFNALGHSDEYVWCWREKFREWKGEQRNVAYEQAQQRGRQAPTTLPTRRLSAEEIRLRGVPHAAGQDGQDDAATFGDLVDRYSILLNLRDAAWQFRPDDGAEWSPIQIGQFWEEQGWDYDGVGWYRVRFALPAVDADRKLILAIGAADENAAVTLNGKPLFDNAAAGEYAWDQRIVIDVTGAVAAGDNELTIKVLDRTGPGGLWKNVLLLSAPKRIADFQPSTRGKKLIEYGWDCPTPAFIREHVREMEKRPFDGLVIRIPKPAPPGQRGPSIGRHVFGREKFRLADYHEALEDLEAIRFEKFTDNFVQVVTQPGDIDWFDPAWEECILHNIRVMAKIAREGHCVGLMIDPEEYGPYKLWTYAALPEALRKQHTLEQYQAQVRKRGEQFVKAINAELPNARLLCLFGPALTYDIHRAGGTEYSLLAPFMEGMCAGADAGTRVIDGCEQSYGYRTRTSFEAARTNLLAARQTFSDGSAFDRSMRVGLGLWLDNDSNNRPWSVDDPSKNYFQPDTWQTAVYEALAHSDEYVWVYSQAFDWWTGQNVSPAYEQAQRKGRDAPDPRPVRKQAAPDASASFVPRAGPRQDDGFDDLLKMHRPFKDLTGGAWRFRPDPDNVGESQRWFTIDYPANAFEPIEVARFWEEQGWDYDGIGWYRLRFDLSDIPAGQRIVLAFGAADESATVWLNNHRLGAHDVGDRGWDQPFSFDVTDALRKGSNVLAVRVLDRDKAGGLWKPVKLFIK